MKIIIIKINIAILFVLGAQSFTFAAEKAKSTTKKEEVVKDSKGFIVTTWAFFRDYDLKLKKPKKLLSQIVNSDISITGYMIPLEYTEKKLNEFLLVPYVPSCSHVPPPPENMIINISLPKGKGIPVSYYPIEVRGKLSFDSSKSTQDPNIPPSVFSMKAIEVKEIKSE